MPAGRVYTTDQARLLRGVAGELPHNREGLEDTEKAAV
jgi:hypothetical protein